MKKSGEAGKGAKCGGSKTGGSGDTAEVLQDTVYILQRRARSIRTDLAVVINGHLLAMECILWSTPEYLHWKDHR